ncbi:extracellular solute-binding protein [Paenibacillus sp. V4I7]|uniref:extracellular solute-binding protein n=1 Tax=Paenibacillus sp. V4I7 TaxID=3042307 RepID=UPI002789F333|nr:extracellular solute-binding protein [Paenibacillus sp. V4I7]MDQ0897813.1 multiple sugar transport system substrate-binding protein [Paenibacillus sp. V4I7]
MKKQLKVTAVALSSVLLLSACGGKTATTSPSSSPAGNTPAAASAKPIEITVWDKPAADNPVKPYLEKQFAAFDAQFPNIKVKHEELATGGKDREQYLTAMAGGQGPDATPNNPYPDMEKYIKQGFALDITDRWNSYADKGNYIPSSLEAANRDGKVYGVPNDMYVTPLIYNKKLFKEAGLDPAKPPATWDEFVDAAKKLTDPSKGQIGYNILGMDWADWFFEYYVWQAGGDLTKKNDDGTATLTFTSDPAVTALQFYKDLKWKHKVVQKNVVQSLDDNNKDFYTGHTGMTVGWVDWFTAKGMDINDIGAMPFPAGPSGKSPSQVGGAYWTINAKTTKEKQDAAWTYVTFMSSKNFYDGRLNYTKEIGQFPNLLTFRTDLDTSKIYEGIPADIVANIKKAASDTHLEYFLKDRLSKYVVAAIQKVLLDQNADPKAELQKQQDLAQKEVIDKYNAEVKK